MEKYIRKQLQFYSQNFNYPPDIHQGMQPTAATPVANFVQKTFEILRLEQHFPVIAWLPSGREFIIKCSDVFQSTTLPRYFRHRNVNSFIRQLNMYGFHKSRRQPSKLIFSHPCFLQGRDDLLVLVRRKLKNQTEKEEQENDNEQEQEMDERMDRERSEDKQEFICSQATKFSLEPEEQAMVEEQEGESNTRVTAYPHAHPLPTSTSSSPDQMQMFAINSFFNIDYESFQLRNLVSNRSYVLQGSMQAYLRMEEAPSLREIGTEEYLQCVENGRRQGRDSFPVRIFETRNCLFELDI